jgi:hypothetical protein
MIRILALGAVIAGTCALPASAQTSGPTGPHRVLSNGLDSCGEFLAGDPQHQQMDVVWVLGYITGADSRGQSENDRNVGSSFRDPQGVAAWVQQYCREHGLDLMPKVAEALRNEFAKREGRQ